MLNLLIQLPLLFHFVLYPVWFTSPPQDPIIRSSAAQRTEGRFVPVLGSTPSAATLLPEGSIDCFEKSVTKYQLRLRNIPEE